MHDSLSQMHPYGNRPDREVLQIRHLSCRLSVHVPVRSSGTGRFVCDLQDEVFHTCLNCTFPEKLLHNPHRIHADNDTRQSSSDKLPDR